MGKIYNRRSLRLKHYDYSKTGYYFITICAQNRSHLFGEIVGDVMILNVAGEMVNKLWCEIINDFSHVALHEFVIMPNHIHGIIEIVNNPVGADSISALQPISALEPMNTLQPMNAREPMNGIAPKRADMESQRADMESNKRADMESAPTLGKIIQSFKRHTTLQYIKMVKNGTLPPFDKRIWQRNYYEHIIRDDVDYERVATYTVNNPLTWKDDVLSK